LSSDLGWAAEGVSKSAYRNQASGTTSTALGLDSSLVLIPMLPQLWYATARRIQGRAGSPQQDRAR